MVSHNNNNENILYNPTPDIKLYPLQATLALPDGDILNLKCVAVNCSIQVLRVEKDRDDLNNFDEKWCTLSLKNDTWVKDCSGVANMTLNGSSFRCLGVSADGGIESNKIITLIQG